MKLSIVYAIEIELEYYLYTLHYICVRLYVRNICELTLNCVRC